MPAVCVYCGRGTKCPDKNKFGHGKRIPITQQWAKVAIGAVPNCEGHVIARSTADDDENPTEPHVYCPEGCIA